MKGTALIFVLVLGVGLSAVAQKRAHGKLDPEKMTERMKTDLDLTEDQYDRVFEANKILITSMEKAGGREASREVKKTIREAHLSSLEGILTEEQFQLVKEKWQRRKDRMKEYRKESD